MTLFELVKTTLDELYAQGLEEYDDETALDTSVKERKRHLSASYRQLHNSARQPIDYGDPATRLAYVHSYVATHGDYMIQVLDLLRQALDVERLFEGDTLRVSCIGGGPGSDILAVLKYLDEHQEEPTQKVVCYLLDREQAWAETWAEIDDSLAGRLRLKTNYQMLDVTDPQTWSQQRSSLKADLFILSYFVSEVYVYADKVTPFFENLLEKAKPGAMILYVDNDYDAFHQYFDSVCLRSGWDSLLSASESYVPRFSEQASSVQTYTDKFGGLYPKLKSKLAVRVWQKEDE